MYYALVLYPELPLERIQAIRERYDPTAQVIAPHITLLFPVPERVGRDRLASHVRGVLHAYPPFDVTLAGFHRSPDHWLLLMVDRGAEILKSLFHALYTSILDEFQEPDLEYKPHLGLGVFVREGAQYSALNPEAAAFDDRRYAMALSEAETAGIGGGTRVDTLTLIQIPDAIYEWVTGRRAGIPAGMRASPLDQFRLQDRGA